MLTHSMRVLPVLAFVGCATTYPPQPDSPTTPIAFTAVEHAGDAAPVIATGGTLTIALVDRYTIGLSGDASDGFAVEPHDHAWPNMREANYAIRALQPERGTFSIATDAGIASGDVEAADAARVVLVSGSERVSVELYDSAGRRLLDGTLALTDDQPGATQVAWDTLQLATGGTHHITVSGDSIATEVFDVITSSSR